MKPNAGAHAPSLANDPRMRPKGISAADVAYPLVIDREGRVGVNLGRTSPLVTRADGTLDVNLGPGLETVTGSPPRVRVRGSDSVISDKEGNLHARPHTSQVRGLGEALAPTEKIVNRDVVYPTLTGGKTALSTLPTHTHADTANGGSVAYADVTGKPTGAAMVLGAGKATLVGGTKTVTDSRITATAIVLLTPQLLGGTVGTLYEDKASRSAGVSFVIQSVNILDTSTVGWLIVEAF